ncbi:MAG: multidrug effflux MFS transporter [Gammaproteobacteria bacterium]|nr:multidrug effflux MFS transporter [Gammaproteobacteria bacterium]MDH4314012.1 multidrug effflux MFS transporter [Gammaproteobacteria bacterium]MDH5214932.1 multidrug effflux MFS transporter [Gammaproteobacteria bacterium]MDH5499765.1 multidrug effflux MFS transporter [Gammaproteobacteria bacterium]
MNTGLAARRRFVLVLGLLTGLAAVTIDMSLPAIPQMVEALGTRMSMGQLIVGSFMAGIALGQLPAGLLSDRLGRMPVLYGGVAVFIVAALACSFSSRIELMLAARFVQGLGASVGVVIARAIVRDIASGREAARLMSVLVMVFTAAPMLAPIAGGYMVTTWNWRTPFIAIAIFGAAVFLMMHTILRETHVPVREHHIVRQLLMSLREFFSHRQCIFGVLLVLLPAAGFMSLITGSSALIIELYGFPPQAFGFIFALAGLSILGGSALNRRLLLRLNGMQAIGIGAVLVGIASVQLLIFSWLNDVAFWWLWGNVCLFMFSTGFLMPNATALALDPVPRIAGVAASIIGTVQNVAAAASAIISGLLYDGSIRNVSFVMGFFGIATGIVFLLRRPIAGAELTAREAGV